MRSPNYPAIGLPKAIEYSRAIWDAEKRTALSDQQVCAAMGYKSLSGASRVVLSALKKYGLLASDGDKWKLSDRAISILHKPQITREYKQAIREAIEGVELFAKLLRTHPDASSDTLRTHLICDHQFTEDGAASFVDSFISTKSLDSPPAGGYTDTGKGASHDGGKPEIKIGDRVQWVSQGSAQFVEPKEVVGISEGFAFVEGSSTGIPMSQLTTETNGQSATKPPANPFYRPPQADGPCFTLDLPRANRVEVRLRNKLTQDEFKQFMKVFEMSAFGLIDNGSEADANSA